MAANPRRPTGRNFFNRIGTMWRGQTSVGAPMLFVIGSLATFLVGTIVFAVFGGVTSGSRR